MTLGGDAVCAEEIAAKLVDRTVAGTAIKSLLAVRWIHAHFEGYDVLEELDDIAISFDGFCIKTKGTATLRIPTTSTLKNFTLPYFLKLYFPFPSAGRRTVLMMIRAPRVRLHQ